VSIEAYILSTSLRELRTTTSRVEGGSTARALTGKEETGMTGWSMRWPSSQPLLDTETAYVQEIDLLRTTGM